jgi:hypothetical protein
MMPEIENQATEVKERKKPGPKPKSKIESIDLSETKTNNVINENVEDNVEVNDEIDSTPVISEPIKAEDELKPIETPPIYERPVEPIRYEIMSTSGKTVMVYRNKNFKGVAIRYKGVLKVMNEVEGGYKVNYMNSGFGYCIGYVKESTINAIR